MISPFMEPNESPSDEVAGSNPTIKYNFLHFVPKNVAKFKFFKTS